MTTKAHKTLTGTDLHEPKGAAAAAINKVYVSDGAGSGTWQKLTASQLTGTGNSFGSQLFHVREEEAQNVTSTGSYTSGAWRTVVLNTTKTNEITSATLVSNQLSLPAATYFAKGLFRWMASDSLVQTRIYNVTDSAVLVTGPSARSPSGLSSGMTQEMTCTGRFTLSGTKTVEFQVRSNGTLSSAAANFGTEVYSELLLWQIA